MFYKKNQKKTANNDQENVKLTPTILFGLNVWPLKLLPNVPLNISTINISVIVGACVNFGAIIISVILVNFF